MQLESRHLKIVNDILKKYPYTFYAYGSRVKGNIHKTSDLDLCFFESIPFNVQSHIEEDFEESDLPFSVDVSDYNLMQADFRELIKKDLFLIQAGDNLLQIEKNLFAKFCYLPEKLNFSVEKTKSYTLINCGLKTSTFNIVCDANLLESNIEQQIHRIIAIFNEQPFAWWLGPSAQPSTLKSDLEKLGFITETTEYAMWLDLDNFNTANSFSNLEIKAITTIEELQGFIEIINAYDSNAATFYQKVAKLNFAEDPNYKLFVGYFDNIPIAVGSLFFTDKLAGIFDLITLDDYRRRGFGSAMLQTLLLYAKNHNHKFASLVASSDEGFKLYTKFGFQTIGIFDCLEWKV